MNNQYINKKINNNFSIHTEDNKQSYFNYNTKDRFPYPSNINKIIEKQINNNAIVYWDMYIKKEVKYLNDRRYYHYYNDIPYTKWPFLICNALFFTLFYGILFFNKFIYAGILTIISFITMLYFIYQWFHDIVLESTYFGKYNRKLRSVIVAGFMLFIVSEVMLFAGFFWAFLDRFFHCSSMIGGRSVPVGVELFVWYKKPLYGTIVLLFSAIAFNGTSYCLKWGSLLYAICYNIAGISLGLLFLGIQANEYVHLKFGISDSIYANFFYILTGFHGFHVIIGLIFLIVQDERLFQLHFTRERHLGLNLAMIYWHFVDIVRIILFILLYVLNTVGFKLYSGYIMG